MATTKFTEAGQDFRLERIKSLRETLKDLEDLEGLQISPEWTKLVRLLRRWHEFAKNEEKRANQAYESEEIDSEIFSRRVLISRQKQADFDFVADILDKTKTQVEAVRAQIERLEKQYKEAKESLS